jgi:hypothetical protein
VATWLSDVTEIKGGVVLSCATGPVSGIVDARSNVSKSSLGVFIRTALFLGTASGTDGASTGPMTSGIIETAGSRLPSFCGGHIIPSGVRSCSESTRSSSLTWGISCDGKRPTVGEVGDGNPIRGRKSGVSIDARKPILYISGANGSTAVASI